MHGFATAWIIEHFDKEVILEMNLIFNTFAWSNFGIRFYRVRNQVKLGVSLRVLYCVVDIGYGLGRSLGVCRSASQKYQMF